MVSDKVLRLDVEHLPTAASQSRAEPICAADLICWIVVDTVLVVAVWLFVATNLDTLVVVSAFCADNDYRVWEVFVGHYVGFCLGLAAAVLGATVAAQLLADWTFLLGIVPLGLGLWGLFRQPPEATIDKSTVVPNALGRIGVVTVTAVGLSGENLAVYIPFFADLSTGELAVVIGVYLLGAAAVFAAGLLVVYRIATNGIPKQVDRWLVPSVLVVIGSYVIVTGVLVG